MTTVLSPLSQDSAHVCASGRLKQLCWAVQVLVPPLKDLECYIFENINTNLWSNVLVETAMSEAFASVAQSANHSPHHPRISQHELAIHRWHDALAVSLPHYLCPSFLKSPFWGPPFVEALACMPMCSRASF